MRHGSRILSRVRFICLFVTGALLATGAFAGSAQATVSSVTADNSLVSQAAGARDVYKIGFTAGTNLTTNAQSTGTITITFPSGTDLSQIASDVKTSRENRYCRAIPLFD